MPATEKRIRKPLDGQMSVMDTIVLMAEGNIGAVNVLTQILEKDDPLAIFTILDLDDMGMRGPQIWVGYKDHCGQDIDRFIQAITSRDPAMVETVNRICPAPDYPQAGVNRFERPRT